MSNVVKHSFVSAKSDGADATKVQPSNWNAEHAFAGGSNGQVLVRDSGQSDGANWSGAPAVSGANLTALPATLPAASAANLTSIPAANVTGNLPNAQQMVGGTGSATPRLEGVLTTAVTSVGTDANTTEKDLWTYTLPANTLSADGRGVKITAWGSAAANANTKTWKVYFGSTVVSVRSGAFNNVHLFSMAVVLRTGSATQTSGGSVIVGVGTAFGVDRTAPTSDTTAAITIKVTGQNGTASANDIVFYGATVELI